MSRDPRFTDAALTAALGPGRAPAAFDRAGRIKLLGEAARALQRGELPESDAAIFLSGALLSWLELGGSLERDYLKVIVNGSHHTPDRVWRALQDPPLKGTTDAEGTDTLAPSTPEGDQE